jgi:ornithine carbamoyltransferase
MVNHHAVNGFMNMNMNMNMNTNMKVNIGFCEDCAVNKITRVPFMNEGKHATKPLDVIHTDLCVPMKTETHQGNRYFISFIDDYFHKAYVYFIRLKNQAFEKFQEFQAQVEKATGLHIKTL